MLFGYTQINCRSEPARDGGLIADEYFPDAPGSNCGSWLAGDGGLIGGEILAGVHIHSCGHGFYWFRFYSESLGKAPSNQRLLPLSSGASPGLGIPSLRSCSVGPPRSAIPGRARLTRHPCRVAHCAEPALGLPMGQEDQDQQQIKNKARRPDSRPDFAGVPRSTLSLQEGCHVFDATLSRKELGVRRIGCLKMSKKLIFKINGLTFVP